MPAQHHMLHKFIAPYIKPITLDSALGREWTVQVHDIAFKSPPECAKGVSSKIALYSLISWLVG